MMITMELDLFDDHGRHVPTFDEWYALYPKKQGKAQARKRWAKMSNADRTAAWDALEVWIDYANQHPQGTTFVPMASTWLNQERWEDAAPELPTQPRRNNGIGVIKAAMRTPLPNNGMGAIRAALEAGES